MSNGYAPIAFLEIENGRLSITEVWGTFSPSYEKGVSLHLSFTTHPAATGNVHAKPHEEEVEVFLDHEELRTFVNQMTEYGERMKAEDSEAQEINAAFSSPMCPVPSDKEAANG